MFKKAITFLLIFAMLVPFTAAAAADEPSATPTVEEILSEYHRKAFEAQTQGDSDSASTWSRRSNDGKTLEQETVDTLTEAGYEAYNVTADNYDTLEAELKTDFANLGLDPEGSYIMVIGGDEEQDASQELCDQSRLGPDISMEDEDFMGGSTFSYTQDDTTYKMRYVTITNADVSGELFMHSSYLLSDIQYLDEIVGILGEYVLEAAGQKFVKGLAEEIVQLIPFVGPICTVGSLLFDVGSTLMQNPMTLLDPGTLDFRAGTAWTRSYIQVYNAVTSNWHTAQCSSYAISEARFIGDYVYDPVNNVPIAVGGIIHEGVVYSPYYNNASTRMARAVEGYQYGCVLYDCTGNIDFYFAPPDNSDPHAEKILLFSHQESAAALLN